jgi:hypothetical protein
VGGAKQQREEGMETTRRRATRQSKHATDSGNRRLPGLVPGSLLSFSCSPSSLKTVSETLVEELTAKSGRAYLKP